MSATSPQRESVELCSLNDGAVTKSSVAKQDPGFDTDSHGSQRASAGKLSSRTARS